MSKRGNNFSKSEEHCLISLIKKYKNVIECKKSNSTTWKEKENSWKLIESEFNSMAINAPRNIKTLKEKYQNLKKKTKVKFAENKLNILKTGGGSYNPVQVDDIDMTIKEILGDQIDGLHNAYDSDFQKQCSSGVSAPTNEKSNDLIEDHNYAIEEPYDDEVVYELVTDITENNSLNTDPVEENQEPSDWSSYCGAHLKRPLTTNLDVKNGNKENRRKPIITKKNILTKKYLSLNSQLIQEKLDFVRLQNEKFLEEHRLKITILHKDSEIKSKKLEILNSSNV